jgi:hypothetical protein
MLFGEIITVYCENHMKHFVGEMLAFTAIVGDVYSNDCVS